MSPRRRYILGTPLASNSQRYSGHIDATLQAFGHGTPRCTLQARDKGLAEGLETVFVLLPVYTQAPPLERGFGAVLNDMSTDDQSRRKTFFKSSGELIGTQPRTRTGLGI